jgi:hypothetical protein
MKGSAGFEMHLESRLAQKIRIDALDLESDSPPARRSIPKALTNMTAGR